MRHDAWRKPLRLPWSLWHRLIFKSKHFFNLNKFNRNSTESEMYSARPFCPVAFWNWQRQTKTQTLEGHFNDVLQRRTCVTPVRFVGFGWHYSFNLLQTTSNLELLSQNLLLKCCYYCWETCRKYITSNIWRPLIPFNCSFWYICQWQRKLLLPSGEILIFYYPICWMSTSRIRLQNMNMIRF